MLDAHFRDLVENGPYLGFADPDVRDVDAPKVWRPAPDPVTAWRALRDAIAARGLPPDVLPLEPVPAETRPDSILPVVGQSVSEPPEREAGRLAFGGLVEGRSDPGGQLPLLPAPEGPRVPLLELADVRGGPIMARGRGAPLDLRLFVGAVLWTPHHARASGRTSRLIRWRGFQVEPAFRIPVTGR